jgi:hypothetical protein
MDSPELAQTCNTARAHPYARKCRDKATAEITLGTACYIKQQWFLVQESYLPFSLPVRFFRLPPSKFIDIKKEIISLPMAQTSLPATSSSNTIRVLLHGDSHLARGADYTTSILSVLESDKKKFKVTNWSKESVLKF